MNNLLYKILSFTHPIFKISVEASMELQVHFAILLLLFLSSIARTEPICESSFCLHSILLTYKNKLSY